jgi:hypothetical protein
MTTTAMVVLLLIGAAGGFPLGVWWAEDSRARHDARMVWDKRSVYRDKS